jgi:hypothetical protein
MELKTEKISMKKISGGISMFDKLYRRIYFKVVF